MEKGTYLGETDYTYLTENEYIMYLRKSRTDNPSIPVEEILSKHERDLQEYAERNLGGRIQESCIIREIVSGETIDERPGMVELMSQIENPRLKGVLVIEPQRLTRGDLEDCGKVVNAFRYSKTEIVTPTMVYDLSNKMQRKFFEQELTRGNDYLEYTKEILHRGRVAAIKRGCYIGNIPPFGYNKIKDENGDNTLEPNENADAVLMAYEMFVHEGKRPLEIARHFDNLGIKPYRSKVWEKSSIRAMLCNKHYIGMVVYGATKTERVYRNGEIVKTRSMPADKDEITIAKGKHQAIVPLELFDAAQEVLRKNPSSNKDKPLVNPLAGIMFCSKCGKTMMQHPYKKARTRIECRNKDGRCESFSTYLDEVVEAVGYALENEQLPALEAKSKKNSGSAANIQKKQLQKLRNKLEELYEQEEKQHDLLESGTYTEAVFLKRNKALHEKIEAMKIAIFDAKNNIPEEIDYEQKIVKLKEAIQGLRNNGLTPLEKNKLLKAIINRIDYEFIERIGKGKAKYRLHIKLLL